MSPFRPKPCGRFSAVCLILTMLGFSPVGAAEPQPGETVNVPGSFLESRLVRPAGAPATVYRVLIDVPPASSPRAAKPRVTESSGDGAVDGIAWDYVKTSLQKVSRLAEMNRTRELRFPLRLVPVAITPIEIKLAAEFKQMPKEGFSTPSPHYPASVRRRRVSGTCRVKGTYPASGGRPRLVILEETSGDRVLDGFTVEWVLLTWKAAPHPSEQTKTTTFAYQMR